MFPASNLKPGNRFVLQYCKLLFLIHGRVPLSYCRMWIYPGLYLFPAARGILKKQGEMPKTLSRVGKTNSISQ